MSPFKLRKERVSHSFVGYKLAHPMLSADATRTGFGGVVLGRSQMYGTVADARCVQASRHHPPNRFCDCGFYCLHSAQAARELACDPQYRHTVMLEVRASGRYIRYEEGLRYAHQRICRVRVGRCRCGRPADVLVYTGESQFGGYRLASSCTACAGSAYTLTLPAFAELAGGVPVLRDEVPSGPRPASEGDADTVSVLAAEAALLQARLDDLQERLSRLSPPPGEDDADGPAPHDR